MGSSGGGVRGKGVKKASGRGGKFTFKTSGGQSIGHGSLRGKAGVSKTGIVSQKMKGGKIVKFKPGEGKKFLAWKKTATAKK